MAFLLFIIAFGISGIAAETNNAYKGKEAWGYVNVRQDAYMFWWLYYKDVADAYANYPLVIWLQGGPGGSSTGEGNFNEIGPYDMSMKPRNASWVQKANLLFLDSPVGAGFSYVTNTSALAQSNSQIADDLVTTLTSLLQNIPEFQKTPLYIFGESYGGKMAADFALNLYRAMKAGKVTCNFKGVAFGDPFISPMDSVSTWGPFLYATSLASQAQVQELEAKVVAMQKDLQEKKFAETTQNLLALQSVVANMTNNVDFFNIMKQEEPLPSNQTMDSFPKDDKLGILYTREVSNMYTDPLSEFMNGAIREKLHIVPKNITWGGQAADVFKALQEDFMKPAVDTVATLLNETTLCVNVYNGQLDLIVNILGTQKWIEKLSWPDVKGYLSAPREAITSDSNEGVGFVSAFKNFRFFWILKAGHMVPIDAGETTIKMLDIILSK